MEETKTEPREWPPFAELPEDHRGLVFDIAREHEGPALEFADAVGSGFLGLVRFARKYEPDRKLKFATGAAHYIRGTILNEIRSHSRLISIPPEIQATLRKLAAGEMTRDDLTPRQRAALADAEKVEGATTVRDSQGRPDSDPILADILVAPAEDTPDLIAADNERDGAVAAALSLLPEKLAEVMRRHFFDDLSLAEIARELDLDRETIRLRLVEGKRQLAKLIVPPGNLTRHARRRLAMRRLARSQPQSTPIPEPE